MKYGATLMSSFLFNVALVLLSCTAAIQFCAQAFSQYANETAIASIFGGQVGICTPPSPPAMITFGSWLCQVLAAKYVQSEAL